MHHLPNFPTLWSWCITKIFSFSRWCITCFIIMQLSCITYVGFPLTLHCHSHEIPVRRRPNTHFLNAVTLPGATAPFIRTRLFLSGVVVVLCAFLWLFASRYDTYYFQRWWCITKKFSFSGWCITCYHLLHAFFSDSRRACDASFLFSHFFLWN